MTFKPELLSPAGTLKSMRYAFAYGADAVYAGQPRYSLRVRNNDFNQQTLQQGIDEAHHHNKKFYLASNIAPHNAKIKTYIKDIEPIIEMQPDALIMSDPGLIMMIRERFPDQEVHLSVQANAVNFATVKFWGQQGIKRVILSRELSLEEIAEIRSECPDMELEVFVHGALCIAYSGRCLLSGYMNKRDPNQGTCTNACRWNYQAHPATQTESGDIIAINAAQTSHQANSHSLSSSSPTTGIGSPSDDIVLLQEKHRPNEYMPMFEDEQGTYIMNSKDLRAIQHVPKFAEMGVHSLKIEGRTKSHYYVARTAQSYRNAIDLAASGQPFDNRLMDELEKLASRGYTEGFYRRHVHDEYQNYENGSSTREQQIFVGEVLSKNGQGMLEIEVKNKFCVGDSLELMTPEGNHHFSLQAIENKNGTAVQTAPGSGHTVYIPAPIDTDISQFALLMKNLR